MLYQQYKIENNEFKKVSTKNQTCYYFDDIIKLKDCDFDNIFLDKKPNDNILVYDISYKTLIGSKPLRIRFAKIDRFIKVYVGTTYLILFGPEKYHAIFNMNGYLIGVKSGNTYVFS